MRIAVIGAGNVGGGFSRAAVAAGHDVVLTAAHPEKARAVATEVGAQHGLVAITAGNYGGNLGRHHYRLRDLLDKNPPGQNPAVKETEA